MFFSEPSSLRDRGCRGAVARWEDTHEKKMKRVVLMMVGYDTGWGSWVVMSVMMVGLWVLVAVAIVAVMRWPWGARDRTMVAGTDKGMAPVVGREVSPAARALLEQRFAGGDIDEAEYRSRLSALMSRA